MREKNNNLIFENLAHCMCDLLSTSGDVSDVLGSDIIMDFVFEETKRKFEERTFTLFDSERCLLEGAFASYNQGMHYFSAVMSSLAVEQRLYTLMPPMHEEKETDSTVATAINEYLQNREQYRDLMLEKYEPLLGFFTVKRSSVCPERNIATKSHATVAICLACYFLFETDNRPKTLGLVTVSQPTFG